MCNFTITKCADLLKEVREGEPPTGFTQMGSIQGSLHL
jgi:hypothetical protein